MTDVRSPSLKHKIDAVRAAIDRRPPCCTGSVELDRHSSSLYYTKRGSDDDDDEARLIYLNSNAKVERLQELTDTCFPVSFGRKNEPQDRWAGKFGKLACEKFATKFDPQKVGIVDLIRECLLDGIDQEREVEVEMDELNVYDQGSFFQEHADTPGDVDEDWFASVIVIFPTLHEGGTLILRHEGEEWSFDSADIQPKQATPMATFIALYGDAEREILPIESGYLVSLVYNLYYKDTLTTTDEGKVIRDLPEPILERSSADNPFHPTPILTRIPDEILLRTTLTLLQDRHFLPFGGFFGFGLSCAYLVLNFTDTNKNGHDMYDSRTRKAFKNLPDRLIGTDAVIKQVCESLSLPVELQIVLDPSYHELILSYDTALDLSEDDITGRSSTVVNGLRGRLDVLEVYDVDHNSGPGSSKQILWITPRTEFITWGHGYADVCLVARVGRQKEREVATFEKKTEERVREEAEGNDYEDSEDDGNEEDD
ncbi:hypothetical protein BDN72DRAFT_901018 [Pluteus cervinus]|uniref:Uncharacterized protein n=1 Tax=Pluteus cervinus TaxID=181527 RepID=A0ACD3AH09_9AGAR|nr:hypothetical protein BDN72DRAFT_901018 [Pluteus cervinus]